MSKLQTANMSAYAISNGTILFGFYGKLKCETYILKSSNYQKLFDESILKLNIKNENTIEAHWHNIATRSKNSKLA